MKALVALIGLFLVSSSCGLEKRSILENNQHHQHHHGHERSARDSSVSRPAPGGYLPPTDDDYTDYGSGSSSFGPSKGISTDGGVSDNPNAGSQDYEYEDEQNQNGSNANDVQGVGRSSPNGRSQSGNRRNQQARNRNQKVKFGQRINQNTGNIVGRRNTNSRRNQQQGGRRNQNQGSRRNQQQGNQRSQLQNQINNLQGKAIDTLAQYNPQDGQIQQGDLNQIEPGQQSNTLQGGSRKNQQFGQQGGSPNQFGNINNQRNPGSGVQSANVANQRDTSQRPNQEDVQSAPDSYGGPHQGSDEENTNRGLPGQNRRNPDNSNFLPGQGNRGIQGQNRGYSDNNNSNFEQNQVQGQDAQSAPDSYGRLPQGSDEVNTNRGLPGQNIRNPDNSNFLPGQGNRGIQGQNRGYSDINNAQFGQNKGVSPQGSGLSGQANAGFEANSRGRPSNKQTKNQRRQHPSRFDGGVSPGQTASPTINRFLPSSQAQNNQGQTNDNAGNQFPALGVQPGTNTEGFPFSATGGSNFNYNDTLICPGGTLETCIQACPGTTAYVYGGCVQECGERCQGGELGQSQTVSNNELGQSGVLSQGGKPTQLGQPGPTGPFGQQGQTSQFIQTSPTGQFSQPGPTGKSSQPGLPDQSNQPGQSVGQAGQFDQQGQSPQFGQIGQTGVEGEKYQQSQYGQHNV